MNPRISHLCELFRSSFQTEPDRFFSAPGRTELCGNHTDHQRGRVLAAAVNLDIIAAVRETGDRMLRVQSEGWPLCEISLSDLACRRDEQHTTAALVRGMASAVSQHGCTMTGLEIAVTSQVLPGSGLSSSAAFEVLLGTVFNYMYCGGAIPPETIACMAQYAENVYFGKPCGLMDQMASAVGNLVEIDFSDEKNPAVTPIAFDFSAAGHALCIIDSRADHTDLTAEYASIPDEMGKISMVLGGEVLSEVREDLFYRKLASMRRLCGDRAVLRAAHFFSENRRVEEACSALRAGDFGAFLSVLRRSGASSFQYLQNVTAFGAPQQDLAVTLALCEHLLSGTGACRVHGGGFAGTCMAFVPTDRLEQFRSGIDEVLGAGACSVLSIRSSGAGPIDPEI